MGGSQSLGLDDKSRVTTFFRERNWKWWFMICWVRASFLQASFKVSGAVLEVKVTYLAVQSAEEGRRDTSFRSKLNDSGIPVLKET